MRRFLAVVLLALAAVLGADPLPALVLAQSAPPKPVAPGMPPAAPPAPAAPARGEFDDDYDPETVLVGYQAGVSEDEARAIEQQEGAPRVAVIGAGTHVLRVPSGQVQARIAALHARPGVRYAEPNYVVHADLAPNDTEYAAGSLWGLKNGGQTVQGTAGAAGADVEAEPAWSVTTGSAAVVVGVVDTGIDYTHPDLAANVWQNPGGVGGCPAGTHGYNAIAGTCDPMDDENHGTHVSGTIGAAGGNGAGVVGVNWTASLMGLKFLDATRTGTIDGAIKAIDFAVAAKQAGVNVRVLNNSWSGGGFSQALLDAINRANANDILFVAAAGNDGTNSDATPRYPSGYDAPNVVAVAASDQNDALASFSNYGATSVDLAAPGTNILSTVRGGYGYLDGTSMATPHVSGAAALVLSAAALNTAQLKSTLLAGVDQVAALSGKTATGGRLNVCRAIAGCAGRSPMPVDAFSAAPLLAVSGKTGGSTTGATLETGEPRPCGSIGSTVWYHLAPSGSGTLTASTAGSGYDTVLALYRGTALKSLTSLACNDDSGGTLQSQVSAPVTAGETYYLQVGGFNGAAGTFKLQLSTTAPAATTTATPIVAPTATATPTRTATATATSTPAPTSTTASGATATPVPSSGASVYASAVLADAPAAYWRSGETAGTTAADSSGHGAAGTYSGGVTLGQAGALANDANSAAAFDGATGMVATTLGQTGVTRYTVEAWVKTTSTGHVPLVQARGVEGSGGQSLTLTVGYDGGQGAVPGAVHFGLDGDLLWIGGYTTSARVNDGRWHHVAGVFAGAAGAAVTPGQFSVYVDGQPAPLTTAVFGSATAPLSGAAGARLGRHEAWNGWLAGSLDEVAVYPVALTAAQIANHYQAGATGSAPATLTPTRTATPTATLSGSPTPTPIPGRQGLQGGRPIDDVGSLAFPHSLMDTLPLIQESGAGWVRINFRLGAYYGTWTQPGADGTTALAKYDTVVDAARARGLRVLGLLSNESWVGGQDVWTAGNAENALGNGDNAYLRAFSQNAAVVLAQHFQGRIDTWEVWNEPNAWTSNPSASVYQGGTFIYPSNFAWLLRHVYEDTRSAGLTGFTFVGGGLFGHDIGGVTLSIQGTRVTKRGEYFGPWAGGARPPSATSQIPSGADYLTATYQQGQANAGWDTLRQAYGTYPLDAVGQHLYFVSDTLVADSKVRGYLDDLRAAYVAYEGTTTAKQTVVTEIGWQSSGIGEQAQADNLTTSYRVFNQTPYLRNAYWFNAQDIPEANLYYGLQAGGSASDGYRGGHKRSFAAYQTAAAAPAETATPTATATPTFTSTPTATPTATATPTSTSTPTPTSTTTPISTPTPASTATPTATAIATATVTATVTSTPTPAATGTSTPTPTVTSTPTAAATATPTSTATATTTATITSTPPATATVPAPAPPMALGATARGGFIRLTWNASATSGATYAVYRGTAPGGATQLIASGVSGTRYDDAQGLVAGQTYYYVVKARNAGGESARSNEASARAR